MSDSSDDDPPPARLKPPMRARDYEIGYGKPPRSGQFTPGRSGNPRGRPKRAQARTAFEDALAETVVVQQNGRRRKLTKELLIETGIVNDAAKGDRHARALFNRRQMARGMSVPVLPPIQPMPVIFHAVFPPGSDPQDEEEDDT